MTDKECPTEPGAGDDGTARGGFAKVAEHLNELYPNRQRPISRQLVHKWWLYRHFNAFPAAVESKGTTRGGEGRPVFDKAEVARWYASYSRHRGAAAPAAPEQTPHTEIGSTTADGEDVAA